jgi:hypothetical protein
MDQDPSHANSLQNYDFSLEEKENYIDIISDTCLRVQFPRKSYIEFWLGIAGEFAHVCRKVLNILLTFARSYLYETRFSAAATIRTNYHSVMNLKNGHFKTQTSVW